MLCPETTAWLFLAKKPPDSVDESELVFGRARGLGTSSGRGAEEFFQAAEQRGVCGRYWLCPLLSHTLTFCLMWASISAAGEVV